MLQPTSYLRYEKRLAVNKSNQGGFDEFTEVKVLQQWWFDTDYNEADPKYGRGIWVDVEEVYEK